MFLSINGPGDLELRPFDLETGVLVTCVLGYLPTNFGFLALLVLELFTMYATDRRTDGRTKATLNAPLPHGRGHNNEHTLAK